MEKKKSSGPFSLFALNSSFTVHRSMSAPFRPANRRRLLLPKHEDGRHDAARFPSYEVSGEAPTLCRLLMTSYAEPRSVFLENKQKKQHVIHRNVVRVHEHAGPVRRLCPPSVHV